MNIPLQAAQNDLADAVKLDESKDQQLATKDQEIATLNQTIVALQKQIADLTPAKSVTLSDIQAVAPETLWFQARSAGAPKTGPHGTITIAPGSPATADFHPVKLAGGHSDNVYCLRRLYPTLTPDQKAALEAATKFNVGCDVALDPLASAQAFELDYQIRKSDGVVINVGLQLVPAGTGWQLRGFDFVKKDWEPIGAKVTPKAGTLVHIEVSATCDGKTVQFVQVIADGATTPVTFNHPVSQSTKGAPYLNCAYQLDATGDAKTYKATVDNLSVTFA